MFTRRLRKAMAPFVVLISAILLISGVTGALQTGTLGFTPFGTAVASAYSAPGTVQTAADTVPRPAAQPAVFIPGTGNPGETGSVYAGEEYVVGYPAEAPVLGNYAASVTQGGNNAADVVRTMPPGNSVTISGYSQGGHAARLAAGQPGVASDHDVTVVTIGDPCTEETGILVRFPLAQAATGVPCAPVPEGSHGVVINRADDPIASFPTDLNGVTVANALAEYSYYHAHGYGPVDLNQTGVRSRTVGNVTYVTIPRDSTPALVRWARDSGFYVSPEIEAWVAGATVRPDPGPGGPMPPPAEPWVQPAAAVVSDPAPVPPDVWSQASVAVEEVWQENVVQPFTQQVENWANAGTVQGATLAPQPVMEPSGNVQAVAASATAVLPPEAAAMVDQVAVQVQNSPLGGFLNGLPPLG